MKFLKTCCFIILIHAALGNTAQARTSLILKETNPVEQSFQDKKPTAKERKKVVIEISKEVGYVIFTLFEVVIELCQHGSGCSTPHNYNHP